MSKMVSEYNIVTIKKSFERFCNLCRFESNLKEFQTRNRNTADLSCTDEEHIADIYGYKVVCIDGRFSEPV